MHSIPRRICTTLGKIHPNKTEGGFHVEEWSLQIDLNRARALFETLDFKIDDAFMFEERVHDLAHN